jgi:predicted 2-oxoglutarate/Fe(II)-dependent dioxygenase YbiX
MSDRASVERVSLERFQTEIRIASIRCYARRCAFFRSGERDTGCPHRSLIFDFVTAFKAMVERCERDDLETVKLAGICHNLILYWTEV